MASLAGYTLTWQGTMLDRVWALNPRAYRSLEPIGSTVGPLFLVLSAALLATGIGWFRRLRWAWKLALVIIAIQIMGDLTNLFYGRFVEAFIGVIVAGALLAYLSRRSVRRRFHSQYRSRT